MQDAARPQMTRHPRLSVSITAGILACLAGSSAGIATADRFTYVDRDGKTVTIAGRLAGSNRDTFAIELPDGEMRLVPQATVKRRVPSEPPPPISHKEMADKLQARFGKEKFRSYVAKPFVVGLVLAHPLTERDERRSENFLKKAGRYLVSMQGVFARFAKRYQFPQHEPRFPLVMLVFESDDDFETYTKKTTGGRTLSASSIAGFYSGLTNWLAIRLNECHNFNTPLHEAIHQQVYNRGVTQRLSPVPTWFQEGIATGFAGDGKKVSISPNKVSTRFARRTHRSKRIDWTTVVAYDSPFRGNDLAGDAYTHAWGMHWLLVTKHKKQYTAYVQKLATKKTLAMDSREDRIREFREAFGKSPAQLQAEFPRVLAVAVKRQKIKLVDPDPPGVGHIKSHLAEVVIEPTNRGGVLGFKGEMFNISPIRPMTFHITVETNAGMYAEWYIPALANRKKTKLLPQLPQKRMVNGRGGRSTSYRVLVRTVVPGSEEALRWQDGKLPVPVFGR